MYDEFAMATAVLCSFLRTFAVDASPMTYGSISSAWDIVSIRLIYTRKQSRDFLTDAELEAVKDDLWRPDWISLKLIDLVESINSECFDPRDQIYGLLSFSKDDLNDIDLTADYSKSISQVYADFAKAYLVKKSIRILNHAGLQRIAQNCDQNRPLHAHISASPSHDTIPSWAPDWRVARPYLALGGNISTNPGFTAGISLPTYIEMIPTNPTKVLISGFHIDTVAHISHLVQTDAAHGGRSPRYETDEPMRASIAALQGFCESHYQSIGMTEYATGEEILTALVRTILADGIYSAFGTLFPVMKQSVERMVLFWMIFTSLKIKPDDAIDSPLNANLPNLQTGEPAESRAQGIRTAWLVLIFMLKALDNHAVCITSQGYLGLCPALTEVGDSVIIFGGSQTPFVLRKIGLTGDGG